jgi:hypothetical protein
VLSAPLSRASIFLNYLTIVYSSHLVKRWLESFVAKILAAPNPELVPLGNAS